MRSIVAAALVVISSSPVLAACPPGAYPWVNGRGIEYCRRDVYGPTDPTGRLEICPTGTRPVTDRWGNRGCKKLTTSSR